MTDWIKERIDERLINTVHFSLTAHKSNQSVYQSYRKILHISYWEYVINEEVGAKIQQANGLHKDLLIFVRRRKLQWYGRVSISTGLAKTILQGTAKAGRRQGRQKEKKRWENDIRERTGLQLAKSPRAVENREKWRKLVVKSFVVHQRPSRLRNRWGWRWRSQFSPIALLHLLIIIIPSLCDYKNHCNVFSSYSTF